MRASAADCQQISESRAALEEKLKADYERALRDEASLQAALNLAKTEAAQQNQAAIQFNILKQEVETTKALYKDFLQKTNQAKIQEHEQHGNMKMIDPPQVPGRSDRTQSDADDIYWTPGEFGSRSGVGLLPGVPGQYRQDR